MTPALSQPPGRPSRALVLPGLVAVLIAFLGYFSQYFLITSSEALPPAGPSRTQLVIFNVLILNTWIAFWRSIFVDPGRIERVTERRDEKDARKDGGQRWCSKCQAPKPERAHHCRICKRCIPKMDHHCPWTANCVSHTTLPYFIRFLVYACLALLYLLSFLGGRMLPIWQNRALPSYLGPSVFQLFTLVFLTFMTFGTLFMVGVITVKSLYNLAMNMTSIESWEVERHEMILRRAKRQYGFVDVPGGGKVKVQRIEFPYEVGIWRNIELGMGTSVWFWMWVFARTPVYDGRVKYERNDFNEDQDTPWPPLDPDRMEFSRQPRDVKVLDDEINDPGQRIAAFRARQENDLRTRRRNNRIALHAGDLRSEIEEEDDYDFAEMDIDEEYDEAEAKLPSEKARGGIPLRDKWMNREGERLEDFGVDGNED